MRPAHHRAGSKARVRDGASPRAGDDPDDPDGDPILQSDDLKDQRDLVGARKIRMQLLEVDLHCLDAHAHLGNLMFDVGANVAIKHYGIGTRLGELPLGSGFDGVLYPRS